MAIAAYTGRFRNRIVRDVIGAVTLGTAVSWTWWNTVHVPSINKWRAHDAQVKKELDAEYQTYLATKAVEAVLSETVESTPVEASSIAITQEESK